MGKGDKKTKKGKIAKSSFGNSRLQREGNATGSLLIKSDKGNGLTELPNNPLKKAKK
jgi:ribosomal small subunit protein bTHX